MRFIKTFIPFGFMLVLLSMMIAHFGDHTFFMACLLGLFGWLEHVELSFKVNKTEAS